MPSLLSVCHATLGSSDARSSPSGTNSPRSTRSSTTLRRTRWALQDSCSQRVLMRAGDLPRASTRLGPLKGKWTPASLACLSRLELTAWESSVHPAATSPNPCRLLERMVADLASHKCYKVSFDASAVELMMGPSPMDPFSVRFCRGLSACCPCDPCRLNSINCAVLAPEAVPKAPEAAPIRCRSCPRRG